MNFILVLFRPFSIQGRERLLCDFVRKKDKPIRVGLYSNIYRPISFKLSIMIKIIELYILISVWMTLTFIQDHSCIGNQKLWCAFSHKFRY